MSRRVAIVALAVLAPGCWAAPARAAQTVTLTATPNPVGYGTTATFAGVVAPPAPERVTISRQTATGAEPIAGGRAGADGGFALAATIPAPGTFVATAGTATSPPVTLTVRPRLAARLDGLRILGAPLYLVGRLEPVAAGRLTVTVRGAGRGVAVRPDGTFKARIASRRAGRVCATLTLQAAPGYVAARRRRCAVITTPTLAIGASGPAVRYLEKQLARRRYALRGVNASFADDTRDAVLAFQKVAGLTRDGIAGPSVWRALRRARTPRSASGGTHIEVDKTRQVLFEVRKGRVVSVIHVSTGATGNTPVGRWRVYRKSPGYNSLGMYDSLYFLRGFAIHGYATVPPYPASHGCVRVPLWCAPKLYSRWPVGARVTVLP